MPTHHHLQRARTFAKLMDNQFNIFGIGFGLDTIVGLIPGAGDITGLIFSLYLLWIGYDMKLPAEKMIQMLGNVVFDTFIGTIPLIGDVTDIFFKANIRNLKILEAHAARFSDSEVLEGEVVSP